MNAPVVEVRDLFKVYPGGTKAVDGISFAVAAGTFLGFLGPNGAGKTTTIRILAGLLRATSGKVEIAGADVTADPQRAKAVVGYSPEAFGVYGGMRVWEYLDFFGAANRIPPRQRQPRIEEVLAITGTDVMKDYFMESLSRGMQQRVGIARTLMHDPKVLLLDEPTSGLDPRARIEIRQLLKSLKQLGKTILVSSHILPELATTCDRIGIIEQGKLLLCDRVDQVLKQVEQREIIEIELLDDAQRAADFLKQTYPSAKLEVREVVGRLVRVAFEGDEKEVAGLLTKLVQQHHAVVSYREEPLDLEKVYLKVTEAAKAGARKTES